MKNTFAKTLIRDIKSSLGRYIAIVAIIALGSGFFIGLKVTNTDMMETEQAYFDATAFFDYRLLSTLGWAEASVEAIRNTEGVADAEGTVNADTLVLVGETERAVKVMSLPERVNKPELVSGRMPEAADECLVDDYTLSGLAVGDVITVSEANEEDTLTLYAEKSFTVVGTARTPLYINFERGTTSIGSGSLAGFIYVPRAAFDTEVYTEINVRLNETGFVYSEAYETALENAEAPLTEAAETAADARFESLRLEARQTYITEGVKEYSDGVEEYTDGVKEYEDGVKEFEEAIPELAEGVDEAADGEYTYRDGAGQFCEGSRALREGNVKLRRAKRTAQKAIDKNAAALDAAEAELKTQRAAVESAPLPAEQKQAMLDRIDAGLAEVETNRGTLEKGQAALDKQTGNARTTLLESEEDIAEARKELQENRAKLQEVRGKVSEGMRELIEAEEKLQDAEAELRDAQTDLRDGAFKVERAGQKVIAALKQPTVYVLSRETNVGYVCFESDANIVSGIAKVFPFFFFAVAALVCVTTTNRLVDEQRGQIGIFKALGYSDGAIIRRYLIYSGSASLLGVGLGTVGGSLLFPPVIWTAYGIMYSMSDLVLVYDIPLILEAGGSYFILSLLVTYLSCRKELHEPAAELLRPKAPSPGKRILLERIGFIWKRLKFLHKVSLRNVFRYRKRLIMMVLGIGGCTALLLTGFGLNDSITHLADRQYTEISLYDGLITFSEDMTGSEAAFLGELSGEVTRGAFLYGTNADVATEKASGTVSLRGIESFAGLEGLMNFHTAEGVPVAAPEAGGCLISRNLAKKYGLSAGDTFTVTVEDTVKIPLRVDGVYDNIIYHYIYTSLDSLAPYLKELPLKTVYLGFEEGTDGHSLGAKISKNESVTTLQLTEDMLERVGNMLSSMKYVVALVIGCAGALSFIVLFNLTNINIRERIREIATIKVLGFYAGESARYIFRENYILTFCGCAAGVPMGMWLHNYVMAQIQIDMMAFDAVREPLSYALAVLVTFAFTALVNLFMRPRLDGIKMAESLKSIE